MSRSPKPDPKNGSWHLGRTRLSGLGPGVLPQPSETGPDAATSAGVAISFLPGVQVCPLTSGFLDAIQTLTIMAC